MLNLYVYAWMISFGVMLHAFHDPDERTEPLLVAAIFVVSSTLPVAFVVLALRDRIVWLHGRWRRWTSSRL